MQIRCIQADHQNQYIIGICIESNCLYQRPYCHACLPNHVQHIHMLITLESLNEWFKRRMIIIKDVQKYSQECKSVLDSLINIFIPYLDINIEQLGISQIDNIIKCFCQIEVCEQQLLKQLEQSIQQVKQIINKILKKIKSQIDQEQKIDLYVQQPQILKPLIQKQNNHDCYLKSILKPFTFDLIKQNSIKQDEGCYAIAFNKDGMRREDKRKLNQVQVLSERTNNMSTLNFRRNTNNFVSGSYDKLIIIWQVYSNNQWYCQQKLNGHSNWILCLLLNNNDDLIISESEDNTIKFWIKQNQWVCQQTITYHTGIVFSLSLNDQQSKVISFSDDYQILVIEQSQLDRKWNVIQKIKVDKYGLRLCFINDNQFIFQSFCQEQMQIYEMDNKTKQYRRMNEITIKCGSNFDHYSFPQQYVKSKCLLVNKNGKSVNLMRKKENGDFIIEKSIEFDDQRIYGQLGQDREYLITWDNKSKEIQIRKCKER